MLGVSMSRACPDQSGYEAARKASIARDLYDPPAPAVKSKKANVQKQANAQRRGGAADKIWGR